MQWNKKNMTYLIVYYVERSKENAVSASESYRRKLICVDSLDVIGENCLRKPLLRCS